MYYSAPKLPIRRFTEHFRCSLSRSVELDDRRTFKARRQSVSRDCAVLGSVTSPAVLFGLLPVVKMRAPVDFKLQTLFPHMPVPTSLVYGNLFGERNGAAGIRLIYVQVQIIPISG